MGILGGKIGKKSWLEAQHSRVSSATLILENSIGQALIVKANYKPYWTFPGGIIDRGETPKAAAIRETLEEVGIPVEPSTVQFVAVVNRKSDSADTYQFIFKTLLTKRMLNAITLQATEIEKYALITREQVPTRERQYGKVIEHWVQGRMGYIEQTFGKDSQ
jgi:8-oxo-dGTP diphosphatase